MLMLADVVAQHCDLSGEDTLWLAGLTDQWDLLADLSFSDLILWVPDVDDNVFWAAAQSGMSCAAAMAAASTPACIDVRAHT